jgi:predicted transposase/invertase (TIGR01784 family)
MRTKAEKVKKEEKTGLLPPSSDFVFKNIFAKSSHKRALISLINSILDGNPVVRDITIENPEIPRDFKKGRGVGLDIRATTNDGTKLCIEIQCRDDGSVVNRSIFCQAKLHKRELSIGEEFDELPNVISIWLTNYDETKRKYHTHEAMYMFKKTPLDAPEIASDKSRIIVVELPKVEIRQASISDLFKVWVYFLRNPEKIPAEFLTIPEVEEAMRELEYVSHDPEMRQAYNDYTKWQNDQINARSHAYNKGRNEGRNEGRSEGRSEGMREAAVRMFSKGIDINDISEVTGLSSSEIEALKPH